MPPVEFTLNGNAGVTLALSEVLQQMWAQNLGVRVTVRPLEFKVYLSTEREKQFQVLLEGWSYVVPDPRDILELGVTGDPNNDTGAGFADYDEAFAASDRTADREGRRKAFDAMEAINAREVFFAPVYYANQGFLVHPSVLGWRDNAIDTIDWRELHLAP
jgi:ABC-type oligopeptide transport system substrate-binding subunit